MPSPSVRVSFPQPGPPPHQVTFDFGRIAAIEDATGRSAFDLLEEILGALPAGLTVGKEATADEAAQTAKRLRLGTVTRFLAACFDVPLSDLVGRVPSTELFRVFGALWPAFATAVLDLLPKVEPKTEAPPAEDDARPTSDASAPGASSTSVSGTAGSIDSPAPRCAS